MDTTDTPTDVSDITVQMTGDFLCAGNAFQYVLTAPCPTEAECNLG